MRVHIFMNESVTFHGVVASVFDWKDNFHCELLPRGQIITKRAVSGSLSEFEGCHAQEKPD